MNKKSVADRIRDDIRSYLKSNFEVDCEGDVWQAIANQHGRSLKRVYNLAGQIKKEMDHTAQKRAKSNPAQSIERRLIVSDLHYPFHHKLALQNVYQLLHDYDFAEIFLNGDILDCYSISSFERDPRKPLLSDEIEGAKAIIKKIRDLQPAANIHFIEGNHEHRLSRLVSANPGLYGLEVLTWPRLLSLPDLDISYTKYKDHITTLGDVQITHGDIVRKHAGYSAKGHLLDRGYQNVIHGHTHRMGAYHQTGVIGHRRAFEIGGLYDRDQADYVVNPNWQNGFCVIEGDEEQYQINLIEVDAENGSFIYGGNFYDV